MSSQDLLEERENLEKAINVQESMRGTIDDAIIDATIASLKEKLAALGISTPQQRKLATILFMDIAGHTALTVDLDPEEQMDIVDSAIARLANKVEEFGGHVARFQGDGFKAVFGLPVAHENDPQQAVRAGLAIQNEADTIAEELKTERELPGFTVRVGITTGPVFAGGETEGKDTIKGAPVNLAARVESLAEPGTVLISHDTYKLVRGIFDFEPLDPVPVKGFTEPVRVYRVLRAKHRGFYRGRLGVEGVETRMVGREAEFIQLQKALADVVEERDRQLVTIVGEAGIGKSRLLYEFENWVDLQPQLLQMYKGRARLEVQGQPYGLLRDLFGTQFNIQDDDSAQVAREKLVQGIAADSIPGQDSEVRAHVIGQLLGYDFSDSPHLEGILNTPRQLREQAIASIDSLLRAASSHSPLLLLFEDLHWADEASLDALNQLAVEWSGLPILILSTTRPNLFESRPNWGEGQEFHRRLQLAPLSKRESRHLVGEVLKKVSNLPEDLRELVVSNAEGNPFYVEELVKLLIQDRVIIPGETNWRVETAQLTEVHVPATLTGVLQARLDGLPAEERSTLQAASVIGRVFWDVILEKINSSAEINIASSEISVLLDHLRTRELIFHRETSAFAEAHEHIFKHALLREVAYESVLNRVRQSYHWLVADWLIEHASDRKGEFAVLIADHLALAGDLKQSIEYFTLAGDVAFRLDANVEAVENYGRALAAAVKFDTASNQQIHYLFTRRGRALELNSHFKAAMRNYEEMGDLASQRQDREMELASMMARIALFAMPSSEHDPGRGQDLENQALKLANDLGDPVAEAKVLWNLMNLYRITEHVQKATQYGERSYAMAKEAGLREQMAFSINDLILCYYFQGYVDQAIEAAREAEVLWRELGNLPMLIDSLSSAAYAHVHAGKYDQALHFSEEALQLSRRIDNPWGLSFSRIYTGRIWWERGQPGRAIEVMKECMHLGEQVSFIPPSILTQADLSLVYADLGDFDTALRLANQAHESGRVLPGFINQ